MRLIRSWEAYLLKGYRSKRDFRRTPEPDAAVRDRPDAGAERLFVMHKHAAQRLHYDLRLEQDGVLRSWALPKGPSLKTGEKRLAVEVEDHPLEYGDFEGVIPKKEYGGGTVMLWDRGRWIPRGDGKKDRLDFILDGEKLYGAWTLARMSGQAGEGGKNWLLIKRRDSPGQERKYGRQHGGGIPAGHSVATGRSMQQIARDRGRTWTGSDDAARRDTTPPDPALLAGARRKALPRQVRPLLATLTRKAPAGEDWIHEIKFDGYRIMARLQEGEIRLLTRNGKDWTDRFPTIATLLDHLPARRALLDGEVVALASDGSSSFRRLQEALSAGHTEGLVYQVFDLVHLNDHDLSRVALVERKQALRQLLIAAGLGGGGTVRYSDHLRGKGPAFLEQACRLGLEGIVSKRADSGYTGGRSRQWLKTKCVRHEEFVVGGYTRPGGSRSGFGSLLLGAYDADDAFVYAGRVGTGFSARQLESLHATLRGIEIPERPFRDPVPESRGAHWVRPERVVEVEFAERTRGGVLRQPAFRGLRDDRDPGEVRWREALPAASARSSRQAARDTRRPAKTATVAGVRLTHPQRVLYPEQGTTKIDLARYYEQVQDWILPHLANRPLSLLRCPRGRGKQCFFQKHPREAIPARVPRIQIAEKDGSAPYVYVRTVADLVALVQAGVLELHPWGSLVDDVERPDRLVFDLDPAPEVGWSQTLRVARELRDRLDGLGLASFVRTTGGKGLHLVVPLVRRSDWTEAKAFARAVAEQHACDDPGRLTTNMSKAKRRGRIFLDYLRNGRGATAIASYSTRAREGAPVAVPVRWDELNPALRSDRYRLDNLYRRLSALRVDPWDGFDDARRAINRDMRRAVGLKS